MQAAAVTIESDGFLPVDPGPFVILNVPLKELPMLKSILFHVTPKLPKISRLAFWWLF